MESDVTGGPEAFEELAGLLNYPMFVVTVAHDGEKSGCLVGFASQTSINPPRFVVGLSKKNHTFALAESAQHLGVHVLSREHLELARLFGTETGDSTDKFSRCDWHLGTHGVPILDHAPAWFIGQVCGRFDVGDHVAHVLEPIDGSTAATVGELVSFADVRDLEPGHDA